jgi:hypothetical protein
MQVIKFGARIYAYKSLCAYMYVSIYRYIYIRPMYVCKNSFSVGNNGYYMGIGFFFKKIVSITKTLE